MTFLEAAIYHHLWVLPANMKDETQFEHELFMDVVEFVIEFQLNTNAMNAISFIVMHSVQWVEKDRIVGQS